MLEPLRIGHRGAKSYVAENTLASVEKALELGVDGIEIDVHCCASGELVVFHDFTLDRLTNGKGEVAQKSLDQLKDLKVLGQYQIPTLMEVLDLVDKNCFLNIELKGLHTAQPAVGVMKEYLKKSNWNYDHFLVSSFQYSELEMVKQLDPKFQLGILTKASVDQAVHIAKELEAKTIHPNMDLLSEGNVREAQNDGFKVIAWTVNQPQDLKRIRSYGVDGIISDNPDLI